jgi:archaellum component FlaG (FlaF/FlaG flagellin family)
MSTITVLVDCNILYTQAFYDQSVVQDSIRKIVPGQQCDMNIDLILTGYKAMGP